MSKPTQLSKRTAESCGTCSHWIARGNNRYCPILKHTFWNSQDLLLYWCRNYDRELTESFAIELYEELTNNG